MPIRVRCPRCWETAELPDEARGKMGRCNSCGAIVKVPERIAKVCFICAKDVSSLKHTKDNDNNYLCLDCWENRNPSQRSSFGVPVLECSICHATIAEGEGFERDHKPVCRDCNRVLSSDPAKENLGAPLGSLFSGADLELKPQAQPNLPPAFAPPTPLSPSPLPRMLSAQNLDDLVKMRHPDQPPVDEQAKPKPPAKWEPLSTVGEREFPTPKPAAAKPPVAAQTGRSGGKLATLLALLALVVAGYAVSLSHVPSRTWEDENRTRLEILKAQGDVLIDAERVEKGIDKYHELLKIVSGHDRDIQDPALKKLIKDAQAVVAQPPPPAADPWEEQNRTKLLVLRSEANILVAVGKYREGIDRYAEMIRMVSGHQLSPEMNDEIRQAQLAQQQAKIDQQRAESRPKPPVVTQVDPRPPVVVPSPVTLPKPPEPKVIIQTPDQQPVDPRPADPPPVDPNRKIKPNIFDDPFPDKPDSKTPKADPKTPKPASRKSIFD